jgi:hypothetical protein
MYSLAVTTLYYLLLDCTMRYMIQVLFSSCFDVYCNVKQVQFMLLYLLYFVLGRGKVFYHVLIFQDNLLSASLIWLLMYSISNYIAAFCKLLGCLIGFLRCNRLACMVSCRGYDI